MAPIEITIIGNGLIELAVTCPFCSKWSKVRITKEKFERYAEGKEKVQDIFPELSADDREILISGICLDCQKKVFGY